MNNFEIEACIQKLGLKAVERYEGCYCVNEIIPTIKYGHFAIINSLTVSEAKKKSVGHWTMILRGNSIYSNSNNNLEATPLIFFDPLGNLPSDPTFIDSLLSQSPYIEYSNFSYQSVFSDCCGKHILFLIAHYIAGISVTEILTTKYDVNSIFETRNDRIVEKYFNLHF